MHEAGESVDYGLIGRMAPRSLLLDVPERLLVSIFVSTLRGNTEPKERKGEACKNRLSLFSIQLITGSMVAGSFPPGAPVNLNEIKHAILK
jgi:hypothetical protein